MKKGLLLCIPTLAVVLAVPLMAQSFTMTANVPFEFTVGDKVLPPGGYTVRSDGSASVLFLRGEDTHAAALTLTSPKTLGATSDPASNTKLTFNRYGNRYFLSEVDNGYAGAGLVLPISHEQRELLKAASLNDHDKQTVTVLARR